MTYPPNLQQWVPTVEKYVPPQYVDEFMWLMQHESGGDPNAANPNSSACGLMQILAASHNGYTFPGRPSAEWLFVGENNIQYAAQQLGAASGNFTAWGQGPGRGYSNPYGQYPGPGWSGGYTPSAPPPPPATWLPPGPYREVGLPPVQNDWLNIPNGQLEQGQLNYVRAQYGGVIPPAQPGMWSFWEYQGNGQWQQYTDGDVIAPDQLIGIMPPGMSLPGGLNPRPITQAIEASVAAAQAATLISYIPSPPPATASQPAAIMPGGGSTGSLGEYSPIIGPTPQPPTTSPTDVEGAWANYVDWSRNQVPAYVDQINRITLSF